MAKRDELNERYQRLSDRIAAAAERSGRRPSDILTVAVTKYASPDQVRRLVELGHHDLGESRVQQLQQRVAVMDEMFARRRMMAVGPGGASPPVPGVRWHMIGHVQRNKVRQIIPLVRLIHSVDSLRLAEELQAQADRADREVEVLIQVDIAQEPTKTGVAVAAVSHLADQIATMMSLKLRGLMTMAPYSEDGDASRSIFERCAELFNDMQATGQYGRHFNLLSMGMSNDFEQAIEAGANVVRVGRALFGEPVITEAQ